MFVKLLFPGVVHLEALDLLSKECESKVNLKVGSGLGTRAGKIIL